MKRSLIFLISIFLSIVLCSCGGVSNSGELSSSETNSESQPTSAVVYVRVYYDLAADDAVVDTDGYFFDEEKSMYYTKIEKGETLTSLLSAKRGEYVLVGWLKSDGSKFASGTAVEEDITLTASWFDKNDTPLV